MFTLFVSVLFSVPAGFRTRAALQAEILALRHQLLVLQRSNNGHRVRLRANDRLLWVWLSRCGIGLGSALIIVMPETDTVAVEVRDLIRRMSLANRLWGAPRIHGEL